MAAQTRRAPEAHLHHREISDLPTKTRKDREMSESPAVEMYTEKADAKNVGPTPSENRNHRQQTNSPEGTRAASAFRSDVFLGGFLAELLRNFHGSGRKEPAFSARSRFRARSNPA